MRDAINKLCIGNLPEISLRRNFVRSAQDAIGMKTVLTRSSTHLYFRDFNCFLLLSKDLALNVNFSGVSQVLALPWIFEWKFSTQYS